MSKSFHQKLTDLLKTDPRFIDEEGDIIKAAVIDRAWKSDRDLVKLLLRKSEINEDENEFKKNLYEAIGN